MEQCREDPLRHIVTDRKIAVGRAPVLSRTGGSLPNERFPLVNWLSPPTNAASAKVPRSRASSDAILNLSPAVRGL